MTTGTTCDCAHVAETVTARHTLQIAEYCVTKTHGVPMMASAEANVYLGSAATQTPAPARDHSFRRGARLV
jgi:hypothetical protein